MRKVYIYGLVDPRDDKIFYIGYSNNPKRRLRQHLNVNGTRKDMNLYKDNYIRKINNVGLVPELRIIDSCNEEYDENQQKFKYEILEMEYIKKYLDSGITLTNLTVGGDGGNTGFKVVFQFSEKGEFLKKYESVISVANHYGVNPDIISKVIDQRGKKSYRTTYLFSSMENAEVFKFVKTKKDNIPIKQYTLDGKFIAKFKSQHDASKKKNICQANISYCLNNKRKQAGGFIWRY